MQVETVADAASSVGRLGLSTTLKSPHLAPCELHEWQKSAKPNSVSVVYQTGRHAAVPPTNTRKERVMRLWIMVFAGASVLALGARGGVAQEGRGGPPGHPNFFERLDADKDGKVALDEVPEGAPEHVKAMLNKADEDGDKVLTKDELEAAMKEMRSMRPGQDGRGEGSSRGPGSSRSGRGHRGPDAERGPSRGPHGPHFGDPGDEHKGPPMGRPGSRTEGRSEGRSGPGDRPSFGRHSGSRGGDFFSKIDKNEDGKIDKEEATGRMKEHFAKVDADKDGKIGREEGRRAMMAAMKARSAGHGPQMGPGKGGPGGPQFGRSPMSRGPQSPMMSHHGRGPQMGPGKGGPGGPQFGRSPMSRGPQSPMMSRRGHGRGPQTGHSMRSRGGQQFGRCPMSRGPQGPMMSRRDSGRGPQMGHGMRGPGGPQFGRSSMSRGRQCPMMSHRGPGRGPQMGKKGMRSSGGPQFGRSMSRGSKSPMMSQRGSSRGPQMGHGMRGRGGPKVGRSTMSSRSKGPMTSRRGPGSGAKACPDGKCPVTEPKAAAKKKASSDGPKRPARPKKPIDRKDSKDKPDAEK